MIEGEYLSIIYETRLTLRITKQEFKIVLNYNAFKYEL